MGRTLNALYSPLFRLQGDFISLVALLCLLPFTPMFFPVRLFPVRFWFSECSLFPSISAIRQLFPFVTLLIYRLFFLCFPVRDNILDCKGQESYQAFKEFKRTIFDPAVKEVNQKTDCHFEYQAIKRGRKVAKIKFIYHSIGHQKVEVSTSSISQQSLFDNYDDCNIDYGSDLANLLGDCACDNEFTPEQIRVIQDLVIKVFPYSTDHMKMCNHLLEKVHKMNYYQPQSKKKICLPLQNDRK